MKRIVTGRSAVMLCIAFAFAAALTGCQKDEKESSFELTGMPEVSADADIDLDALKDAADAIGDLDLGTGSGGSEPEEELTPEPGKEQGAQAEGELTKYSYTDVVRAGNDITVTPNGGLNGSIVLYGGKDLNGFLDYVDDVVLEKGRTINRDMFFDLLAIMLVDKDLTSDFDQIEKNMLMALAVSNNFHDMKVDIRDCHLDADNASEYRYDVSASGIEDTWIVNYGKRTFYMNNGSTEYSSTMFNDENLAVWMVAIEEYYL